MIEDALKTLSEKNSTWASVASMILAGDTFDFIEAKTGIPDSSISDMYKRICIFLEMNN